MKRDAKILAGLRRREFLRELGAGAGAVALGGAGLPVIGAAETRPEYRGPNVIIIRYGGGVRLAVGPTFVLAGDVGHSSLSTAAVYVGLGYVY